MKNANFTNFTMRACVRLVRVQAPAEMLQRLVGRQHRIEPSGKEHSQIFNPAPDAILALSQVARNPIITELGVVICMRPRRSLKTERTARRLQAWIGWGLRRQEHVYVFQDPCVRSSDAKLEESTGIAIHLLLDHAACQSLGLQTLSSLIGFRFRRVLRPFFRIDHASSMHGHSHELVRASERGDVQANRRIGDALGKLQVAFSHEQMVVRQLVRQAMRPMLPQICTALVTDGVRISVPRRSTWPLLPPIGTKLLLDARCNVATVSPS